MANTLARKTFAVSRLAEFVSVPELAKQVGQPPENWPLVIAKELIDNALDAAEESGAAPVIDVTVESDGSIVVADEGPGIPPETVASLIDFTKRTSSRAAYVSPTRGQQGNALQSLIAMPYALDGGRGETLIESSGVAHRIVFTADPVRQEPRIAHTAEPSTVKNGTRITVRWPDRASSILDEARSEFLSLAVTFIWTNPHLALSLSWRGEPVGTAPATAPGWSKWRPNMPTSPHWYDQARLSRLIAAMIAHAEDHGLPCPTLRDFVREFRGLSSTVKAKDISEAIGASGETLADFHRRGDLAAARLLAEMQGLSRPVQPRDLGVIGKDHLLAHALGAGAVAETFEYRCTAFEHDGLPYVIETAFALCEDGGAYVVEGFNFTPAIGGSPFRLEGKLAEQMVSEDDPVIAFAHVVSPRLDFLDRGKARVALPYEVNAKLIEMVGAVTQRWRKQRKAEERHARSAERRMDALSRERRITIREAAFAVMAEAYRVASANGTLPANARQIYYAARPMVLEMTGKDTLDSAYFTQTLLIDYIEANDCDWNVAFDARGHLAEPHGGPTVGLGTLEVRHYLDQLRNPRIIAAHIAPASVSTYGPAGRYGAALFVEKEGFLPILAAARIAERFDLALMSTKGMSVTAARQLVDDLAGKGVRLFVLHDFDISGFSIRKTLTESGRRHRFRNTLDFVDLGLRLADVERLSLQSERVGINEREATRGRLATNGATEDEIEFLLSGQRVELNAMPSDVFVRFIEEGLAAHGVTKVIPDAELLAEAYGAMRRGAEARATLQEEIQRVSAKAVETPADLAEQVERALADDPTATWITAVAAIAEERDPPRRRRSPRRPPKHTG